MRIVTVEIEDTGIGIDPLHLDRVFDAFEQGDRQITRQFGGIGLGSRDQPGDRGIAPGQSERGE